MENTSKEWINAIVEAQRAFYRTGATLNVKFRKEMLKKFGKAMQKWEKALCDALWQDLHKSYEEAYLTEISIVEGEIRNHLKHVGAWARRERRYTPVKLFPASSYVVKEPLGNTLIVAPWNYPVQLLLNPLVGAISAGCTAVLKPSPYVPNVSRVIEEMIADTFDERYVAVVQGNRDVNAVLFATRFDLIFFTGSPDLGKKVMKAAADTLTPVILELGGKSPCIVDRDADVKLAARRIAWGKSLNSGQTCIAPDYLILHSDIKAEFVKEFTRQIALLHGDDVQKSAHFVRMVNDRAFRRVSSYLEEGKVLSGGRTDAADRFIEPTILDGVAADAAVLNEEIFGPVLPIVEFGGTTAEFADKTVAYVTSREKPLAFYYFGRTSTAWDVIRRTSSGGACINDTIMHIANENIPFGGVGNSGLGAYHDVDSFNAFSHRRSVVSTATWLDLPFRYMPYKFLPFVKKLL